MNGGVLRAAAARLAFLGLVLTGCSAAPDRPAGSVTEGPGEAVTATDPPTGPVGAVDQPLGAHVSHLLPSVSRAVSDGTVRVGLAEVHRVSPDVVAVVAVVTVQDPFDALTLSETTALAAGDGDFSRIRVTIPDDDTKEFRPLRTDRGACLCTPLRILEPEEPTPVHALIGVPAGVATVNVTFGDLGTVSNVTVLERPVAAQRSGLGWRDNIEVLHVERSNGIVQATVRLENPSGNSDRLPRGVYDPAFIEQPGLCFRGLTVLGSDGRTIGVAKETDCQRGYLPVAGRSVELRIRLGDPGGASLTFLPSSGIPLTGPPTQGTASAGDTDLLVGRNRYQVGPIEVTEGTRHVIRIPTDSIIRTPPPAVSTADETTDDTADDGGTEDPATEIDDTLQDSQSLVWEELVAIISAGEPTGLDVSVHAGGEGQAATELADSRQVAAEVIAELRERLGEEWTVGGTGVGQARPLVPVQRGLIEPDVAAAVNARIEITFKPEP